MSDVERLRHRVAALEQQVERMEQSPVRRGIRNRSYLLIGGFPLYDIAFGPDPELQEVRGHARGIIAIGDIATGILALGGVARGVIALGGIAIGAVSFGGCALGLLVALGGLAVGSLAVGGLALGLIALGGGAIGIVAVGGGAVGYYVCGGATYGQYVADAMHRDPEAVRFFSRWIPGFARWHQ
jgi:hypothetical protein